MITCPPDQVLVCKTEIAAAATNYAEFVAQGGTASDDGCYSTVTVVHLGDTDNHGAGGPAHPYILTRTYRATDCAGNARDGVQTFTVVDAQAPVVTCPGDIAADAEAGLCSATVTWHAATAVDNCDGDLSAHVRYDIDLYSDGSIDVADYASTTYTFPVGEHSVTAKVADAVGNIGTCSFRVTVRALNKLVVSVQLAPTMVAAPITRCITFELWKCPDTTPDAIVNEVMTFTNGQTGPVTVLVPCGVYTCITARDRLHTLRRTTMADIVGTQYVAAFTGPDELIGGNLNDDAWIDIFDFGVFSWKYATKYLDGFEVPGPPLNGNTACYTSTPHADISGDGKVDTLDFTFIRGNFLKGHEANCCGAPGLRDEESAPVARISVAELVQRGLAELAAGDWNGDGWLDEADMAAFLEHQQPPRHPGDLNCDGSVNFDDINPFVLALTGAGGYYAAYPDCAYENADCNGDGAVDFDDINPFVALLVQ
jgi:hypothetical protein